MSKTLTIKLENKVTEKQLIISQLEKTIVKLQEDLACMKNNSKSEIADIASIFNQETHSLQNRVRMSIDEVKERESEICHLNEKLRNLTCFIADTSVERNGLPVELPMTGVTIRADEERSREMDELRLLSNVNRDAMNAIQENMKNYLDSI
jgi:hypothetical protein